MVMKSMAPDHGWQVALAVVHAKALRLEMSLNEKPG